MENTDITRVKRNVAKMVEQGAPERDIDQYIASEGTTIDAIKAAPSIKMDLSATQAGIAQFVNMVPFGADAFGAMGAAIYGQDDPRPFSEKKADEKAMIEEAGRQSFVQHPVASTVGAIAGAVAPALMIPAKALQGASVMHRAGKGAMVAGGLGAAHGAGQGNTLDDRVTNAITSGVLSAPFGAGASVSADVVGRAFNAGAPRMGRYANKIYEKTKEVLGGSRGQAGQQGSGVVQGTRGVNNPPTSGQGIPLTQGQLTQSPKQQALEYGAQAGIYGDDAQRLALETREIQSEAAKAALGNPSVNASTDMAESISQTLKGAYQSAKAKTNAAYRQVGEATQDDPLMVAGTYVRETMFPQMRDWLRKGDNGIGFDLNATGWNEAKRLYQQAETIGSAEKINSINFSRMEFWRAKLSNRIANTTDPAEKKFLGGLMERYDAFMKALPREAIKSGDDAIVDMMRSAQGLRREQGVLFEKSRLVKDILQNDSLTYEQLGNTLTSLGPKTGSYVRDVLRTAKDPAVKEGLRADLRQGVMGSVLNRSLSSEISASTQGVERMVSFDKLSTNLEKLLKNQSLVNEIIPDKAEQAALFEIYKQVQRIKSVKPGTRNYSNTAYTMLNFLRHVSPAAEKASLPLIGSLGGGLERWGQGGAALEIQQSLAPVLKGVSEEMKTPMVSLGEKYGRQILIGDMGAEGRKDAVMKKTPREFLQDANGNTYYYPER